jgi:hypothetical protein
MRSFAAALIMFLLAAAPVGAGNADIRVTELVITSKIVKGKPIDSIKRLSSSTDKNLYCFTRTVAPAGTDSSIRHIWYKGDEKAGEFTLSVKGEKWRTQSKKSIPKGWAGDWRVEVVDESGRLLKTVRFRMN